MDEFIGTIKMFGFNFTPRSYELCQGQLMQISQNTALFSLLGTAFGGNGSTTFGLPDLRGRVPIGMGQGPGLTNYTIGNTGGVETVTLNTNQMPQHNHLAEGVSVKINASDAAADQPSPTGHVLATSNFMSGRDPVEVNTYSDAAPNVALSSSSVEVSGSVAPAGGSQPHENRMPYLALNFCICTQGIFPSRQ